MEHRRYVYHFRNTGDVVSQTVGQGGNYVISLALIAIIAY